MKVYIGKPKNWFGPYQLAERLMFWIPKEKDEYGFPHTANRVHRFGEWLAHGEVSPEPKAGEVVEILGRKRPVTLLYKLLSWIHSKRSQKCKVVIHNYDVWSAYTTIATVALPLLKKLKEEKHGSPYVDDEDVIEHLRSTAAPLKKNEYDVDEFHHDRWSYVLDEMIFAFEHIVNENLLYSLYPEGSSWYGVKQEDGTIRLERQGKAPDYSEIRAVEKRIQNGCRLFGKYFQSLWS
jgi:hypothetical protein